MDNIPYINRMLFEPSVFNENDIDTELSDVIKMMVSGNEVSEEKIKHLKSLEDLSVKQKVLLKYIISWKNEN